MIRFIAIASAIMLSTGTLKAGERQTVKRADINWPWVYPVKWKISPGVQWQSVFPADSGLRAPLMPGIQAELVHNLNFLFGLSFDYARIAPKDSISAGRILKTGLTLGFMIPLDKWDIHHLVLQFNPALSMGKFRYGNANTIGYTIGVQYEFTLFSNHILAPGIFYSRFPPGNLLTPSLGRWSLGFRYIIGK